MNIRPFEVSILIVNWNTRELLEECLSSIREQLDSKISFETIVVDNASSDGTQEMIRERFPEVKLVENTENVGFANAVNQAAGKALGKYFLLLNSDAHLLDDRLGDIVEWMDSDESIGVASGVMTTPSMKRIMPCNGYPSVFDLLLSYTVDCIYRVGIGKAGRVRKTTTDANGVRICEADWISGSYMLVRRELMDGKCELLDPRIFMYFEDTLLCKKAWDRGYRVIARDTAEVYHIMGSSSRKASTTTTCHSYSSSRIYLEAISGKSVLWWYESVNRSFWRVFVPIFYMLEYVGLGEKAKVKRTLFQSLLSVPRLT